MVVAACSLPPLREPQAFRTYAEWTDLRRHSNFLNVVSNLAFLVVGAWGLYLLAPGAQRATRSRSRRRNGRTRTLFLGVALTSIGSAYTTLRPTLRGSSGIGCDDVSLSRRWRRRPSSSASA